CLQRTSGDNDGPEEGSDAWLLLHALIGNYDPAHISLKQEINAHFEARFEQSGRWLAEQGATLDVRLQGLQRYIDALALELKDLFNSAHEREAPQASVPSLLFEATSRLYQLQSSCMLALTRGYQSVIDQH